MLALALTQPVPDFLSLIRRHLVKPITQLLASVRAELAKALEVLADAGLVPCRQVLKLLIAIANCAALIITQPSPGLKPVLRRSAIFGIHLRPATCSLGKTCLPLG